MKQGGKVVGWVWTVLAAGAAVRLFQPAQALTAIALLLSAVMACPPAALLFESKTGAKVNGALRLGLAILFAGFAGLSFVQDRAARRSAAVAPPAPKMLLEADANGNTKTASFTTPGQEWSLDWSFDCAVLGDSGIFNVKVMRKDGSVSANAPVEKINDHDSGTEHYKQGGTFYLDVISECPWHVRVAG